jgi:hypothetical protein
MSEFKDFNFDQALQVKTDYEVMLLPRYIKCEDQRTFELLCRKFRNCHISISVDKKELTIIS